MKDERDVGMTSRSQTFIFPLLTCHAAVDNGIELVVACGGRYDTVEVSAVDVGDEDLPESVARDEADDLLHA